jgi:eukaryotic-like serine/threonine-protein kinase
MATVLPKADRGLEMADTRVSMEPRAELPMLPSRRPYGPGDLIDGKYELEALLGKGGMGEVWTAKNETLGVRRAVKLIRADAGNAESTDRLLHEAQAAARLADPSIVRVFDFGKTVWGDPYIVMELLEGEDLMSIINRRERLSPTKAVRVLLPLIRALGAAHAHGIVHRDLKPENIFLSKLPDGRVQPKLLDFGIAKLKNARALRLTTAGAVLGSPLYMSPEQARGEDVDERADIWACCVVLYEAITGTLPFPGDDRPEVLRAVAELAPEPLAHHGVNDTSLWPIISRGLEKQRDDRWPCMDELGRALARWLLVTGVSDDITGSSLEAGWFRSSPQSLFASSMPPERKPADEGHHWLAPGRRRAHQALLRLRTLSGAGARKLQLPNRTWRWGLGLGLVTSVALTIMFLRNGEPETRVAPPALAPAPPSAAPALVSPVAPAPPSDVEAAPRSDVRPEGAESVPAAAPPTPRPQSRAVRKPSRAGAASETQKERRRSKLIDPYQ